MEANHSVVLIEGGNILASGTYNSVVSRVNTPFVETMKGFIRQGDDEVIDTPEEASSEKKVVAQGELVENLAFSGGEKEKSAKGSVPLKTYYTFFTAGSNLFVFVILIFSLFFGQAASIVNDWWLSRWTSQVGLSLYFGIV